MKNRERSAKKYRGIINNIYKRIIIAFVAAVLAVYFLRDYVRGRMGNFITSCISAWYGIYDWEEASYIYYRDIRVYYTLIIAVVCIIFFMIIFRIVLHGFTQYFDEILDGIDSLSSETQEEIKMSKEIDFVQYKLQSVKDELEKGKKEKEEAEKRKNDLIVYLAHDIKTPLTSVIGYVSLLNENPDMEREERVKYTDIALKKAERLEQLINEFFEITRSHAQTMVLEKEKVDLSYLLEQVIDETYPILAKNQKKVEVEYADDMQIEIDPQRMARVFTNLLKNACNYSEGQIIRIFTLDQKDSIQVVFENEGNIPQEHLEHLFEKFYRVDEARQTKTGGAGLGLAIAKEIIVAHKGSIDAECSDGIFRIIVCLPK